MLLTRTVFIYNCESTPSVMSHSFEKIIGRKVEKVAEDEVLKIISSFNEVDFDLGTGDGMFAYRLARKYPERLVVGLDTDRASLAIASRKASKKPSRGGCRNVIFLCMNALHMPSIFTHVADRAYVNFPWGGLMLALCKPDVHFIENIHRLLKPGGKLEAYLNAHIFEDPRRRESLGVPNLDDVYVRDHLLGMYREHGLIPIDWAFLKPDELKSVPSTWAGRLVRGSGRTTFRLVCEADNECL